MSLEKNTFFIIKFKDNGYMKHANVLRLLEKLVFLLFVQDGKSPWVGPALEAASRGCAVIISNREDCPKHQKVQ